MSNSASPVQHAFSPVKRGRDIFIGAVRGFYRVSAMCRAQGSGAVSSVLEPDAAAADAAAAKATSGPVATPAHADDAARAATVARSAPTSLLLATPPATSLRTPSPVTPNTATPSLPKRKRARVDDEEVADAEAGDVATATGGRGAIVVKMPEFSPHKGVQDDLEAWRSETASSVGAGMSMLVIG